MNQGEFQNERFKAWVYAVINPVLEGVRIESAFLTKKNWTFRFHSEDLEFVRPLEEYVEFAAQPNLEDFLESHPEHKQVMAERDQVRERLREQCGEALTFLVNERSFLEKVSSCKDQFTSPGQFQADASFTEQQFPKLVAERVVNNISDLPQYYGDYAFWSAFRDELVQFRVGEVFRQADQAGAQLQRSNDQVSAKLRDVRKRLANEHGVPFAPYPESVAHQER